MPRLDHMSVAARFAYTAICHSGELARGPPFRLTTHQLGPIPGTCDHHPADGSRLAPFIRIQCSQLSDKDGSAEGAKVSRQTLPKLIDSIELPKESEWGRRYLDDLDDATCRKAVAWLIESLPHVSEIKATLESGTKLAQIEAYPGAIGILRWVVASCRAYLKELRTGDGVLNDMQHSSGRYYSDFSSGSSQDSTTFRQFAFVVDSPEKEAAFAQEVQKSHGQRAADHPTMLVFHGGSDYGSRAHDVCRFCD